MSVCRSHIQHLGAARIGSGWFPDQCIPCKASIAYSYSNDLEMVSCFISLIALQKYIMFANRYIV